MFKFIPIVLLILSFNAFSKGFIVPVTLDAGGDYKVQGLDSPIGETAFAIEEIAFNNYLVKNKCIYKLGLGQIACPGNGELFYARFYIAGSVSGYEKNFVVTY